MRAQRYLTESAAVNVSPKYTALNAFWQGEIAFAQGDYPVAAAKYNAYLKRAPRTEREYALAWYNLGYCAFDRNDLGQAQASFRKFLAAWSPRDRYRADAYNRLGDAAYSDRRFEEAVGEYDKAIALATPEQQYARYKRAVTLGILGRTDQKQQALRQIAASGATMPTKPPTSWDAATSRRRSMPRAPRSSKSSWPPIRRRRAARRRCPTSGWPT